MCGYDCGLGDAVGDVPGEGKAGKRRVEEIGTVLVGSFFVAGGRSGAREIAEHDRQRVSGR